MAFFFLAFFSIYGGIHVYVFMKVRAAFHFGPRFGVPLAVFMLLMVLAPVIVRLSEREGLEYFARVASCVGYVWLGLVFFFFTSSLAVDAYRVLLRLGGAVFGRDTSAYLPSGMLAFMLPFAYALAVSVYGYFEAGDIRVERVRIVTPKLSPSEGPIKVVQISDVHLGLIVRNKRLGRIVDKIKLEAPDLLVSTGDLVDGQINSLPGLAALIGEVEPRYGKFAVTGNHEFYAGIRQALSFVRDAGFRVLRGEGVNVGGVLNIAGVDDPTMGQMEGGVRLTEEQALSGLSPDRFTILLKHRPYVRENGLFDLQLSGHTHRGQMFPFNLVTRIFYPYLSGLYELTGSQRLYVSRGTGTWGPPVRFLSPPEVTVIEIEGVGRN